MPRLDAFANAQHSNPNSRVFPATDELRGSWDAGLQLTWRLSDAASAGARSAGAEARARAADERKNELIDAIRLEVLAADQDAHEALVARDTSARGLAAAEESYRARRLLYQNGRHHGRAAGRRDRSHARAARRPRRPRRCAPRGSEARVCRRA